MADLINEILIRPASDASLEGIFYFTYLATQKNQSTIVEIVPSTSFWGNPYSIVTYEFTGNYHDDCFATLDNPNSNLIFHLLHHKVRLTHYSIRTRPGFEYHYTKNWNFEGSNDGKSWVVLDTQEESNELMGINITKVFKIKKIGLFQYFRFIQTGLNSNQNNYLVMNNLELFGKLCPVNDHFCSLPQSTYAFQRFSLIKDTKTFLVIYFTILFGK